MEMPTELPINIEISGNLRDFIKKQKKLGFIETTERTFSCNNDISKSDLYYTNFQNENIEILFSNDVYKKDVEVKIRNSHKEESLWIVFSTADINKDSTRVDLPTMLLQSTLKKVIGFVVFSSFIEFEILQKQSVLPTSTIIIVLKKDWIKHLLKQLPQEYEKMRTAVLDPNFVLFDSTPLTPKLLREINNLIGLNKSKIFKDLYLEGVVLGFLNELFEYLLSISAVKNVPHKILIRDLRAIRKLVDELMTRLDEPMLLCDAAKKVDMSISKFKSLFTNIYEETYYQYFLHIRLKYSKELLETGKYSVQQISDMVGFDYPPNYIKAFKKKFGISPLKSVQFQ